MNQEQQENLEDSSLEQPSSDNGETQEDSSRQGPTYEELLYSYSLVLSERDYLREELERVRRTERFGFFTQFINLFSTVLSLDPESIDPTQVVTTIQSQIRQTLTRVSIEPFIPEPGQQYDTNRHQSISSVPTTDPDQIGRINRVFGFGFRSGDTILSRANVTIFTEAPPSENSDQSSGDSQESNTQEDPSEQEEA